MVMVPQPPQVVPLASSFNQHASMGKGAVVGNSLKFR